MGARRPDPSQERQTVCGGGAGASPWELRREATGVAGAAAAGEVDMAPNNCCDEPGRGAAGATKLRGAGLRCELWAPVGARELASEASSHTPRARASRG